MTAPAPLLSLVNLQTSFRFPQLLPGKFHPEIINISVKFSNQIHSKICCSLPFSYCVRLVHLRSKGPLLNRLVKVEVTVYWAYYGGVNVRGIFMRDVWPGVKPGNVRDKAKSQEALRAMKVPHTRGVESPFSSLKTNFCAWLQVHRNYRESTKFNLALNKSYAGWKASF